jgi:hypothetical protein
VDGPAGGGSSERALDGSDSAVTTSSPIVLASGAITPHDSLRVELHQPIGSPAFILVHGVNFAEVRDHIREVRGVVDVHDLHAWTITSGVRVLSAHVIVDHACISEGRSGEVLDRLGECLGGHFDVSHCTFQLEPVGHQEHEAAHHA